MEHSSRMELVILIIGAMVLAGVLTAINGRIQKGSSDFVDKDRDGEPDEPDGPAKDL